MKDYIKLLLVFLLLSTTATIDGQASVHQKIGFYTFGYVFCLIVLTFGLLAYKKHTDGYIKSMYLVSLSVQLIFFLALPYLVFNQGTPLNNVWPLFPEVLWTTGKLVLWYYVVSFIVLPIIVYLFGRRAWCSFVCGTAAQSETLGDMYRTRGPKAKDVPLAFVIFKWALLIFTVAFSVYALTGNAGSSLYSTVLFIVYIMLIRTFLLSAVNLLLMPKLGSRVWCRYFCPQGLVIGLISRVGRFALVKDPVLCSGCGTCNRNCHMSVDITNGPSVNRSGECVGCGICVELCPQKALSMTTDTSVIKNYSQQLKA